MTKGQTLSGETKDRYIQIVLETLTNAKPQTTQELIAQVQEKTNLSPEEITQLIFQLESENKIRFTQETAHLPLTLKAYVISMRAIWYWGIFAFALIATLAATILPDNILPFLYVRSALGLVFVLFLPGYAFIRLLFPSNFSVSEETSLDMVERVVFSFCISLSLVPATAFALNYLPFGITLTSVTFSLLSLTLIFATVALLREFQHTSQVA